MKKKNNIKKFLSTVLLSLFVIGLVGCKKSESQTLMKINGDSVSLSEVKFYLAQVQSDFERQGGSDIWETDFGGQTAEEVAKERTLDSLIWLKILKNKAAEMGLTLTTEEEELIKNQSEQIFTQMDQETIQQLGLTKPMLENMFKESMLSERVYLEVTKDFEPEETESEEFYQSFYGEDPDPLRKVRVRHILLQTHELDENYNLIPLSEEKQEKAKEKAEEALKKAKSGEDFVKLVEEYSEDPGSKDTGGEYTFTKYDSFEPAFVEAAFALQPGGISELVPTSYGYHIIKLEEQIEPTKEEIDQNKEQIKEYYKEMKKQEVFQGQYEEWKKQADIELDEKLWGQVHIGK